MVGGSRAGLATYGEGIIEAHRRIEAPQSIRICGIELTVLPGVFSPALAHSSRMLVQLMDELVFIGKRVLDVGTGCGILAVKGAVLGARRVLAADISDSACHCVEMNARRLRLKNQIQIVRGDLFGPLSASARFDIILANLPFLEGEPTDTLERAFFDPDLSLHRRFFEGVDSFLAPGGEIMTTFSDIGDISGFRNLILKSGLEVVDRHESVTAGGTFFVYLLRPRDMNQKVRGLCPFGSAPAEFKTDRAHTKRVVSRILWKSR